MQKTKGKKKVGKKTRQRKMSWWIIFGATVFLVVFGVIVGLVYSYQSLGLEGVAFTLESGFYDNDIYLEIKPRGTLLMQPIDIKYNMNGDDLENTSKLFNENIKLEAPEGGYKLYTITAMACKENGECLEPQVATYVLGKKIDEDVTMDIININSSQHNLYDYDTGIMVGGRTYDENKIINGDGYIIGNYNNRGKKWMRDAHVVRFDINGKEVWNRDAYIGVSGETSACYRVKSLKLITNTYNDVNEDNVINVKLRSGSQDQFSGNIRSSVVSRLAEESRFDGGMSTRRVVVFLNGEYYGIFDMQNSFSKWGLMRKFKLTSEKKIERFRGSEEEAFRSFGLGEHYWDDLDVNKEREELEKIIDMEDYLKYYAIMIMVNNTDWPMGNFEAWRYKKIENTDNKFEDGKIRFLIGDTDLAYLTEGNIVWFEGVIGNTFEYLMENRFNGNGSSFKKVMESEYYREKFIDLLRDLLNGPFATKNVLKIIDEEAAKIEHQMKLFSTDEEYDEWAKQIELMKRAASKREEEIKADVQKYFGVKL